MKIAILDTTLRDGEQSPGFGMNTAEKLRLAMQLEALGVDVIEAGFPAASAGDAESVAKIAASLGSCGVAALARAIPEDIEIAAAAVSRAVKPRLHVFMATSDMHLKYKLRISRTEALRRIAESTRLARRLCGEVEFSAEDASRTDPVFLRKAVATAIKAGASIINLPDTVGYATPDEISAMVRDVMGNVTSASNAVIAVHCHDDLGLAVANTLAGLRAGATQAECTICGIGERAGNAALEEVVMGLRTRSDAYGLECGVVTEEIARTARLLSSITGVSPFPSKAIIGENAFAHESGVHQHGVIEKAETYEIISPESVGITDLSLVLGKHSGRHAVARHLEELGFKFSEGQIDSVFASFKALADRKKTITDKDLAALAENLAANVQDDDVWNLEGFVVNSGSRMTSTACVTLSRGGKKFEEVAAGSGPVYAAFRAIEKIAKRPFKLLDYRLQAVTERRDALGEARVTIADDGGTRFRGRGVSTDVIEASILACVAAVNAMR